MRSPSSTIVLIDNSTDTTGASKALLAAAIELKPEGFTFVFIFPTGSRCKAETIAAGFDAYTLPIHEIRRSISSVFLYVPRLLRTVLKLRWIARKHNAAIVHTNDLYNLQAITLKLFLKVKAVSHIRRMPESFPAVLYKAWIFLQLRYADALFAVSRALVERMAPTDKVSVVHDPLPDEEIHPRYVPVERLNGRVRLLYLANYTLGKGHNHAIEAFGMLRSRMPGLVMTLDFYGGNLGMDKNDSVRAGLEARSRQLGLEDVVTFHGKTTDGEATMKAYDVLLNLSDSESFSRVTLEALFYGIPTVATDVGGTREMVIHGETGLLCAPFNPQSMAEAIERVLSDDDLRCRFSSASYAFVRETFGPDAVIAPMARTYHQLLGHKQQSQI